MKTVTEPSEIAETFADFEADSAGAFATCRLIPGADSAMDPQEWAERGYVGPYNATVYYIFSEAEASDEDASNYPFDVEHIDRIELSDDFNDGGPEYSDGPEFEGYEERAGL